MDSLTQNCGGLLIRTFSLGPMDTKLDPFLCFFLMAAGEILISVDTDGFLDPKLLICTFFRTNGHQARPILAKGEISMKFDVDVPATYEELLSCM